MTDNRPSPRLKLPVEAGLILDASKHLNVLAKAVQAKGENETADWLVSQAAQLELASPEIQTCWGGPFNGQNGREAIVIDLLQRLGSKTVVETGTYRGISTEWFAQHSVEQVITCEKEQLYYLQAMIRLSRYSNVRLQLQDSRTALREICTSLPPQAVTFFYLDAHGDADLPLAAELQIIFGGPSNAVVMIDDFKVPDDSGYEWDDWGVDNCLDVKLLQRVLPKGCTVFFPVLPAREETGARRGCCVIASNASSKIDACKLLRGNSIGEWVHIQQSHDEAAKLRQDRTSRPRIMRRAWQWLRRISC